MGILHGGPAAADIFDDISHEVSRTFDTLLPDTWQDENARLAVGGGILRVPQYEGSSDYKIQAVPIIDFRLNDTILFQTNQVKFVATEWPLRMGAFARLDLGRGQDAHPNLANLEPVGTSLETGGFAEGQIDNWVMQFSLRQDILSGHKGMFATLTLARLFDIGKQWRVIVGSRTHWANSRYMDSFFGISPAEAAASGFPSFNPGGGIKDVGLGTIVSYAATEKMTLQAGFAYERLLSGAKNSPIVRDAGSPNQLTAGFAVRFILWRTDE